MQKVDLSDDTTSDPCYLLLDSTFSECIYQEQLIYCGFPYIVAQVEKSHSEFPYSRKKSFSNLIVAYKINKIHHGMFVELKINTIKSLPDFFAMKTKTSNAACKKSLLQV